MFSPAEGQSSQAGMTIVEIAVGIAILGIIAATGLAALTTLNRNATSTRVMANAREVVQSYIETAIGTPFTTASPPEIWKVATVTSTPVITANQDDSGPITGTMTCTVTNESNSMSADIRRLNCSLAYSLFGKSQSYQMATIRSTDK